VRAGNLNNGKILETRAALRGLLCRAAEGCEQEEVAVPSTKIEMKPVFLRGVEQGPQPGPYAEMSWRARK
jgi:hypothetical protein